MEEKRKQLQLWEPAAGGWAGGTRLTSVWGPAVPQAELLDSHRHSRNEKGHTNPGRMASSPEYRADHGEHVLSALSKQQVTSS